MTSRKHKLLRIVMVVLAFSLPWLVYSLFSGDPFSQTGFIVSGDIIVRIWDETRTVELFEIEWGNIYVNQMNTRYLWMEISEVNIRFNYFTNNPSWSTYELFYESVPGRWSRWSNNSLCYLRSTWTHLMVRFTALSGAPDGFFNFTSFFAQV